MAWPRGSGLVCSRIMNVYLSEYFPGSLGASYFACSVNIHLQFEKCSVEGQNLGIITMLNRNFAPAHHCY